MRIGDVNQDNYKYFLQLFGVKDSKALDAVMGKEGGHEGKVLSEEETYQKMVKMGYIEEGMLVKEGDTSYMREVPVSDEVKEKIIATVRRHFLENGNGMSKPGGVEGNDFRAIMTEYRKSIPPSERLAVTYTLSKIQMDEERRLVAYVKANNPTWNYGQRFDKDILLNSNFGENSVDVKI
jgi:hypothetical protein